MEALLTETVGSALQYEEYRIASVFIGGGTPSVVPAAHIVRLMAAVRDHYHLTEEAEVTMEVNPGTVSGETLKMFREAGINRLSIGLQSADDRELAVIGRIHTWQQFKESFRAARKAGFANINVDIMSALPGQTLSGYQDTLEKVLSLEEPPEHISAYSLIPEEGTPLYDRYEKGILELPDEDADREMYQETKRVLGRAGYERYEISNYAKKGYACRHNCGYWQRKNYVGFGIGAASLKENVRFRNRTDLDGYLQDPLGCREEVQVLSRQEQMEEFMFLGLRMTEGVSPAEFGHLFGHSMEDVYGKVIRNNVEDGLLQYLEEPNSDAVKPGSQEGGVVKPTDGMRLALTDRGLDLSNYVMAQFLL